MKIKVSIEKDEFFVSPKKIFTEICNDILKCEYFNPLVVLVEGSTWDIEIDNETLEKLKFYSEAANCSGRTNIKITTNNYKLI